MLADQPVPPGLFGHDPSIGVPVRYDPAAARALLDRFGYKDRNGDGYRETPEGKPLTLVKGSTTDADARASDELWKRNMDAIGIRITFLKNKWPELNRMTEAGHMMMWGLGWISGIPDGDPFYSYLLSRNIGTSNDARLRLPEYDRLYDEAHALPDGPRRNALFAKLNRLIVGYSPWIMTDYPYRNDLDPAVAARVQAQRVPALAVGVLRRRIALTAIVGKTPTPERACLAADEWRVRE